MIQKIKDGITTFKEALVVAVFVALFAFPGWVNNRLNEAGFTKGSLAGFEWQAQIEKSKQDVQKAGQAVDQIQQKLEGVSNGLAELQQSNTTPANSDRIKSLTTEINESRESIRKVDANLKTSLLTQEAIINTVKETPTDKIGWIFLGRVTNNKTQWIGGRPQTINEVSPQELMDAVLTVRDNVYLREDTNDRFKTTAPVLSVVKEGEQVKVLDIHYSSAKAGGEFVWVKVERLR